MKRIDRPACITMVYLSFSLSLGVPEPALAQIEALQSEGTLEDEIIVSSKIVVPIREIGTAVSIITAEDIQLSGYNSMAGLLRTQAGIAASNTGGAGKPTALRIRGEEGYRTLVMIDGVELADPSGTQVGPTFEHLLAAGDIERIEILRGAQGFIYGADAGGVVNILTRTGEGPMTGEASLGYGDYDTRQLEGNLSGGSATGDYFFSISDLSSDGYNSRTSDTDLIDDDGYENTTLHAKAGWTPTEDLRIQLVARDIEAENEFDRCGFPVTNDCLGFISQTALKLSGDYSAGRFSHSLALANTDIERSDVWAGAESFTTDGSIHRIDYTGSVEVDSTSTFVYGAALEREQVTTSSRDNLDRAQMGTYFEYQTQFNDTLFVTAGARRDDNDDFGKHTSVRVSTAYLQRLGDGATLKYRTTYGTGFRAPSLSEIAHNNGPFAFSPTSAVRLLEESSSGFDVGIEYVELSGLYLGATYFNQVIEDEIFFDLANFSGYLQALGSNLSRGIELVFERSISRQWDLLGNLTVNDTENQEGQQRIRRPKHLANVSVRFSSTDDRFRLLANYRFSRNSVDELFGIGRVPLDDYQVLDISATFRVGERLKAFGRLENVTDEDYQEVTGFRSGGVAAYAGARVRF